MHSAFLYHAIQAGMDMEYVNPSQLAVYTRRSRRSCRSVEDVRSIAGRIPPSASRLWGTVQGKTAEKEADLSWRNQPWAQAQPRAGRGIADYIDADTEECRKGFARAIEVIEGPLMDGMNIVGDLFGAARCSCPRW